MKMKIIILLTLLSFNVFGDDINDINDLSMGYHWYNDPKDDENEESSHENIQPENNVITKENAEDVIERMRKDFSQSKALAILSPTIENIANYKRKQDMMAELASNFSSQWQKALLMHPELDYSLKFSHNNSMAKVMAENDRIDRSDAIKKLTNEYGIFFFYNGSKRLDKEFAGVVHQFSLTNKVAIVAISVGKDISPYFPLTKADRGIVENLQIKYFPAVMLVNPKTKQIKPLSYGFMSLIDLENRFLAISNDFKPNY